MTSRTARARRRSERDPRWIASGTLLDEFISKPTYRPKEFLNAQQSSTLFDARTYSPSRQDSVLAGGNYSRRVVPRVVRFRGGSSGRHSFVGVSPFLSFATPRGVSVCRKRKVRKQVLHAAGVAGGRVSSRRRYNYWSTVSCGG